MHPHGSLKRYPLGPFNAPAVCEALKGSFARFGLPMTVQSDQGSNFQCTRDSVQESLGFSPYELVFGHTVRGALTVVKDQWLNNKGGETGFCM